MLLLNTFVRIKVQTGGQAAVECAGCSMSRGFKGLTPPPRVYQKRRFLFVKRVYLGQMRLVCGILVVGVTVNQRGEQSWVVCLEK